MTARQIDRWLGLGWSVTIALLALGHVPALRNVMTIAVAALSLARYVRRVDALPCKGVALAILVVAASSIAWSAAPLVSWSKWRSDLAVPILAGAGCLVFAAKGDGFDAVVRGLVAGLVALALLSAFAYLPASITTALPEWIRLEPAAGIVSPLPRWYPGPGDASLFAILAIPPLYVATLRARARRRAWRWTLWSAWPLGMFVLITTNNRNAVMIAPLVLALLVWLDRRRAARAARGVTPTPPARTGRWRRRATIAVAVLVIAAGVASALEWGARERLKYLNRTHDGESAAFTLAVADTRPAIWRYYVAHGLRHPWFGLGFGRTVPGIGLDTQRDRALTTIEPNAYIHAHNLVLNWWLQLGVLGIGLLVAAALAIVRAAKARASGPGSHDAALLAAAVQAVLVATFLRNLTDDLMVFGMATAFCVVIAALLGDADRARAAARPDAAQRAP